MATLKVIIASTRPGRVGLPVADWFVRQAVEHSSFDTVEVLDLAEINLPFMDEPAHPRLRRYTQPHTLAWSAAVGSADAFVIVSPEYNFSYPASIKNALDYLSGEWAYKPVGLVTYGGISGGLRAANDLRPVLSVLKMIPVTEAVAIPMVANQVVDGEFLPTDINNSAASGMLDELAKLESVLAPLRQPAAV